MFKILALLILCYNTHSIDRTPRVYGVIENHVYEWEEKTDGFKKTWEPRLQMKQLIFFDKNFKSLGFYVFHNEEDFTFAGNKVFLSKNHLEYYYEYRDKTPRLTFYDMEVKMRDNKVERFAP